MNIEKGMTVKVCGQLYNGYVFVTGERNGGGPTADFVGITEFGEEFSFGVHNIVDESVELAKAVNGLNISVAGDRDALELAKAVRGLNLK